MRNFSSPVQGQSAHVVVESAQITLILITPWESVTPCNLQLQTSRLSRVQCPRTQHSLLQVLEVPIPTVPTNPTS